MAFGFVLPTKTPWPETQLPRPLTGQSSHEPWLVLLGYGGSHSSVSAIGLRFSKNRNLESEISPGSPTFSFSFSQI